MNWSDISREPDQDRARSERKCQVALDFLSISICNSGLPMSRIAQREMVSAAWSIARMFEDDANIYLP